MGSDPDADVDAGRDHRLQRLAAALGIEHLEHEAVLLEKARVLAELRHALLPAAALADRDFERVLRSGSARKAAEPDGRRQMPHHADPEHRAPPALPSHPVFNDASLAAAARPAWPHA